MEYEVVSAVAPDDPRLLRAAGEDYPESIRHSYLQIPSSAAPVQTLAQQIAGHEPTPYDKVTALQRYLEHNYLYTLSPPPPPRFADRVVWFLTESKRGYCDLFASALTIMARSLGVPARVATGFATGKQIHARTYRVAERDAHAWVEVFFPKVGWVSFDPQAQLAVAEQQQQAWQRSWWTKLRTWARGHLRPSYPHWVVGGTIATALLLLFSVPLGQLFDRAGRLMLGPPMSPGERVCRDFARMCATLGRYGLPRRPSTTALEYLEQISQCQFLPHDRVVPCAKVVTDLFMKACYGPKSVGAQEAWQTGRALRELNKGLRRHH